jgi:hypothetical protein
MCVQKINEAVCVANVCVGIVDFNAFPWQDQNRSRQVSLSQRRTCAATGSLLRDKFGSDRRDNARSTHTSRGKSGSQRGCHFSDRSAEVEDEKDTVIIVGVEGE